MTCFSGVYVGGVILRVDGEDVSVAAGTLPPGSPPVYSSLADGRTIRIAPAPDGGVDLTVSGTMVPEIAAKPPSHRSRGLGDTVAKVLEKAGVKPKRGCGCRKRQAFLNRLFPYRSRSRGKWEK